MNRILRIFDSKERDLRLYVRRLEKAKGFIESHIILDRCDREIGMLQETIEDTIDIKIKIHPFRPFNKDGPDNAITFEYKGVNYDIDLLYKNYMNIETIARAIESFRMEHKLR